VLTTTQVNQFAADGFSAVEGLFSVEEIGEVRAFLDPWFERFAELRGSMVSDNSAKPNESAGKTVSPELDRPTLLDPRLRETAVYRRCRDVARQLRGSATEYVYDHAIYKAPYSETPTPWHQDQAYNGHRVVLKTVHFWIPLQHATVENGCMFFVPGSHVRGFLSHVDDGKRLRVGQADWPDAVACPIPLGGATLHTPLTLHYTPPNRSAAVRRAWILHFGPWGRWSKLHPAVLRDKFVKRVSGRGFLT
jgi:hypothetical protein